MSEEALTNIAELKNTVAVPGAKGPRPLDDLDEAVLADVEREVRRPLKALLRAGPSAKEHNALVAERKAVAGRVGRPPALPTRDLLIQKQYDVMKAAAPAVLRRLVRGAIDESDPLHERCLDIVAKRVAPIAFFEAMSKSEFKTEDEGGAKPQIAIHIHSTEVPKIEVGPVDVPFKEVPPK